MVWVTTVSAKATAATVSASAAATAATIDLRKIFPPGVLGLVVVVKRLRGEAVVTNPATREKVSQLDHKGCLSPPEVSARHDRLYEEPNAFLPAVASLA